MHLRSTKGFHLSSCQGPVTPGAICHQAKLEGSAQEPHETSTVLHFSLTIIINHQLWSNKVIESQPESSSPAGLNHTCKGGGRH